MALPTLDAVFASAAAQPRRYMLSQWLVGEKEEVAGPSSVLVSGAGSEEVNGVYTERGEFNGKPYYNLVGQPDDLDNYNILWDGSDWYINFEEVDYYFSDEDVDFPWEVTGWTESNGDTPAPTVTETPAANPIANYLTLPERYLWAKIAVAAGAPKDEAFYINAPKQYAWKDIYNAVSGSSLGTIDWSEKQALGHIAAAYRGDTGNPANLATYIDWPWRYQVTSIIEYLAVTIDADAQAFITASGATDVSQLNEFIVGIKALGIWDDFLAWPLRSTQNAGTGTTAYSFGGLGEYNGTLVNGPTWGVDGIDLNSATRHILTSLTFSQPVTIFSVFQRGLTNLQQRIHSPVGNCSLTATAGNALIASAGIGVTINTSTMQASTFYTAQVEFNDSNGSSSFNGDEKIARTLGVGGNSGFIIGDTSGTGAVISFVAVVSQSSVPLIHNLYRNTLGAGLGLP